MREVGRVEEGSYGGCGRCSYGKRMRVLFQDMDIKSNDNSRRGQRAPEPVYSCVLVHAAARASTRTISERHRVRSTQSFQPISLTSVSV